MSFLYVDGSDYDGYALTTPYSRQRNAIVFVHSMNCGHCVAAKPIFEQFCKMYEGKYDCFWCDIDDTRGREFLRKLQYDVRGVPTFLKFRAGIFDRTAELYERSVDGMLRFVSV